MIVADTDVLIDFLAGRDPGAGRIRAELDRGLLRTTAVTRFELLAGARNTSQESAIRHLLAAIPTLPLDQQAADHAAQIQRNLQRAGEPIGMADSLIAGTVLSHGATLLTRNRRHFERVSGLRLADLPTESA
jgi:tRNA(fMet)-specific endonuclease VapC